MVVLLLTNFTLVESYKAFGGGMRTKQVRTRRRFYHKKSGSSRYYTFSKVEAKDENVNKFVVTSPPILPDHPSMQHAKRLNYLATNKKAAKSNIGRLISSG